MTRSGGWRHARERGVALITALFVVALAVIAGVAMFEVSNLGVHRTANLTLTESAWWYADGIEAWVTSILLRDAQLNKTDSFDDIWAQPVPYLPIDNGAIRGRIEDLQGRFNLNNLATPDAHAAAIYLAQFQRLIDNLPDLEPGKLKSGDQGIGNAVRDWITASAERSGLSGAKDGDYLSEQPPYRTAAQPMANASELLLVKGMSKELYAALKPYVTALPIVGTTINVNTALPPVLLSLAAKIDASKLQAFVTARQKKPLENVADLASNPEFGFLPAAAPGDLTTANLSVVSNYFELQAEVVVGSGRVALYSVIYRPSGGVPVVIAHSTNTE